MPICRRSEFILALTLLGGLTTAVGQAQQSLDPRVDPRLDRRLDQRMDGRALDANNLVGSGGYNVDSRTGIPNSGNLLITGNITAGRAFRGFSPVRDPSQLFLNVPSSSLSVFQRDSIGVGDIVAGRSQAYATPFFDPSSTTTLSGSVGLPMPSANLSSFNRPYVPPRTDLFTGRPLGLDPGLNPAYPVPPRPEPSPVGNAELYGRPDPALLQSPLFGVARPGEAESLSRSHRYLGGVIPDAGPAPVSTESLPGETYRRRMMLDGALGRTDPTRTDATSPLRPQTPQERDLLGAGTAVGQVLAERPGSPAVRPSAATGALPPSAGSEVGGTPPGGAGESELPGFAPQQQNVYEDFQSAVRWIQDYNEYRSSLAQKMTQLPSVTGEYEESMSFARALVEQPPKSFAGADDSLVNQRIRRAEEMMKLGAYYSAASQYEVAGTLDRENPLIALGQGHALLAAGDYLSAVLYLTRGIDRFEGIDRFKINLYEFVPDPNTLDIRRADLETKLERREDYRLRFLLGYIEYYSGLEKFGLPNLKRAAEAAPSNSVIARFPAMLESKSAP